MWGIPVDAGTDPDAGSNPGTDAGVTPDAGTGDAGTGNGGGNGGGGCGGCSDTGGEAFSTLSLLLGGMLWSHRRRMLP